MKIENLDRAIVAQKELKKLDQAIAQFDCFADKQEGNNMGFVIAEHIDGSGFYVDRQYKDGNYHPMYADILEFTREKFIQARLDLLKEIDKL